MPRNLSRLRFRAPKPPRPLNLSRIQPGNPRALEREVRNHVLRLSKPATSLGLRVVVDQRWKQQPGDKTKTLAFKPHTLRDMVDPEGRAKHGQIIYVFRNTKTNQVIYSLAELLDNHHLEQLPFIGKHSKPPVLRPDEWAPHCIVTFPSAEQGLHAFRKLREFRRLHELSWNKTNPGWNKLPKRQLMEKIMDQVANTSADLAEVLNIQEQQGEWMRKSLEEHEERAIEYMDKKWPEIDALANASLAKEKREADDTNWLKQQIKSLDYQLGLKTNQNEADQKRLKSARRSHEVRLTKILYAQRKADQFKKVQEKLEVEAELASEPDAEDKLASLKEKLHLLRQDMANPTVERTQKEMAKDKESLKFYRSEIVRFEKAFAAKRRAEARDHYIARSILPPQLKKQLPKPFTMHVEIKWADLRDAEWAAGKWPVGMSNEVLSVNATKQDVRFMRPAEYDAVVEDEVRSVVKDLEKQALQEAGIEPYEPTPTAPEQEKTGVWKYLPEVRNPFKRAEA